MRVIDPRQMSTSSTRLNVKMIVWANALLFLGAVLVGAAVYSNRIGSFGDAVNMFKADPDRYPSAFAFVRYWYTAANGRLGGFITDAVFQRLAAYGPFTPDNYPWWLLCSISLFGALATPVNLGFACARLLEDSRTALSLMVAVAWALWVTHPVLLGTSFLGQAVGEYFIAFYAFSTALLALAVALRTGQRWWFAAAAMLYLYASVSYEQVLAAAPVVFSAAVLAGARRQSRREVIGILVGCWILTVVAAAVVLASPGQRIRATAITQVTIGPSAVGHWLVEAMSRPFSYLLPWLPQPVLWSVPLYVGILLIALVMAVRRRDDRWLLGCGFLMASPASMAHMLVGTYAPERASIFPSLLLLVGLGLIVSPPHQIRRVPQAIRIAAIAAIVLAAATNLRDSASEFRRTVWLSRARANAYHTILAEYARTGKTRYQLADCPTGLDAPWGTAAYFSWRRSAAVDVQLEGRDALSRGTRTVVSCRVPPLRPVRLVASSNPAQVRALLSLSAENRGIARYDYWVPATADTCDLVASANPNAAGSPEYRDTVRYQLAFTNQWDYAASRVARAIAAKETVSAASGGTRVGIAVAWHGAEVTSAPLANWPATPGLLTDESALVRVIIDHPAPGNLGDYDRVSLSCR